MTRLDVVFPSRRPDRLVAALASLRETTPTYDVRAVVVADTEEVYRAATPYADLVLRLMQPVSALEAWNIGAAGSDAEWLGLGADDLLFRPGWIDAVWPYLTPEWDVVGWNDGITSWERLGWATHFAMSRRFCIEALGGVMVPPVYRHGFIDPEICRVAQARGRFVYVPEALVEHMHVDWHKAEPDAVYAAAHASFEQDRATFARRAMLGFPVTWQAVMR